MPHAEAPEPPEIGAPPLADEPPPDAPATIEEKKGQYDWLEQALAGAEPKSDASTTRMDMETEATAPAPTAEPEAPSVSAGADIRSSDADVEEAGEANVEAAPPQPAEPELVGVSEPVALAAGKPETPSEPVEHDESVAAPEGPVIIGRYESNGASYVLYGNGTIDATTPSGVFHFASMAELKAFIESKS